jgi:hypothetical protein
MILASALSSPGTALSASVARMSLGCWNSEAVMPGRTRRRRFFVSLTVAV